MGFKIKQLAGSSKKPPGRVFVRIVFLLWVSLLAFGLPEIFAGTGRLWLSNPGTYVLALPLYALHFILFCHLAIKTGRTSWPALYLFGLLFGLYETWITKVVWNGYPGSDGFSFGGFGPWFGVHETLGLILFYHAVISFLLPLAVVSRLFPAFGQHFPVPDWVFGETRSGFWRRIGLLLILGTVTGHNNPVTAEYLQTWLPFLVLIWLGYIFLRSKGVNLANDEFAEVVARPTLSRIGFFVGAIWLAAIYVVPYQNILPDKLPPAWVQLVTLGFYPVLFLMLKRAGRSEPPALPRNQPTAPTRMPWRWLLLVFAIGLLGNVTGGTGIGIRGGFTVVSFLSMVPLGVGLFVWLGIWKVVLRR